MKPLGFLLPLLLLFSFRDGSSHTARLTVNKSFFRLGNTLISVEKYNAEATASYIMVSLHGNDTVAITAMKQWAGTSGSGLLWLVNKDRKDVEVELMDRHISFDPNTIFTSLGRRDNLKQNNCYTKGVAAQIGSFAYFLMEELPAAQTLVTVSALGLDSVNHYTEEGVRSKAARKVAIHDRSAPGDFVITCDQNIFDRLDKNGVNAVLLHEKKVRDDGSLQVYCMRMNIPFVKLHILSLSKARQKELLQQVTDAIQ